MNERLIKFYKYVKVTDPVFVEKLSIKEEYIYCDDKTAIFCAERCPVRCKGNVSLTKEDMDYIKENNPEFFI